MDIDDHPAGAMEFGSHGNADGDFGLSSSAPNGDGPNRNSRLARKAESARQARLRHKQFVTDLQDQAAALQARIAELEAYCVSGPGSAAVAFRELKGALSQEQLGQLKSWLVAAQGNDNLLTRYENAAATLPPPTSLSAAARQVPSYASNGSHAADYAALGASTLAAAAAAGSAPIAIMGGAANGSGAAHWRGGGHSVSPMESDEDAAFPMSRSWDDCEVARSILNLNSPNGFHPLPSNGGMPPPAAFSLPNASSMPSYPTPHGSMLSKAGHGSSMLGKVPPSMAPPSYPHAAAR